MEQYTFKTGDKVNHPARKTRQSALKDFRREVEGYKLDHFVVERVNSLGEVVLNRADGVEFSRNCFDPTDLELYGTKVPIYEIY